MKDILTTEPCLKTDSKTRLHNLADRLVGEQYAQGSEQQQPQNMEDLHENHFVRGWIGAHETGMGDGICNVLCGNRSRRMFGICKEGGMNYLYNKWILNA